MPTGKEMERIVAALLSAFPTRADLAMLVRIELDASLAAITSADNLRADAFALVEWADSQGRLDELVAGARRRNPGNALLRELGRQGERDMGIQGEGETPRGGDSYSVGTAKNSVVGPQGFVINTGGAAVDADAVRRLLAAARGEGGSSAAMLAEVRAMFAALNVKVDRLFGHIDLRSLQSVALVYARLDTQEHTLSAAIAEAVQQNTFAADELDRHLAVIRRALAEVQAQATPLADSELAEGAGAALRLAEDPTIDAKHKLEVTLPLIPLLLSYKFEAELGSRANLVAVWEALKAKAHAKRR